VLGYPNVAELANRPAHGPEGDELVLTCDLRLGGDPASLYTTLTTFGTPRDITLDELVIELFFPADAATEQLLRAAATNALGSTVPSPAG
jgi:hypothetical protein